MAGRPPLPLGAHGKLSDPRQLPSGMWEVMCRVRDPDGETRKVKRQGGSRTAAVNNLRKALAERRHAAAGEQLTGDSRVRDAAATWFGSRVDDVESGHLARSTLTRYEIAWRLQVDPPLGALRLREVTVQRCEAWARALRRTRSAETARSARTVLSGVMAYALRMDAIPFNPVRDISPIRSDRKPVTRALTRNEVAQMLGVLDGSRQARGADLPDLTRFMLATGCRLGEALAVSWDEIDLDAGTLEIRWHLVPVKGEGLRRVEGAKSAAGERVLQMPRWCVAMLLDRRVASEGTWPVFPDRRSDGWRWPGNVARSYRRALRAESQLGRITSHTLRRTCLTLLDEAGLTPRVVADVGGHADPSMTLRAYMGRGRVHADAAAALDDLL